MTTISVPAQEPTSGIRPARSRPRWLREWWVFALAVYCIGFGIFGGYPYGTLDERMSRVSIRPDVPWHYPLLVIHILFGVVAVLLAWLQVWPWLRERHPAVHRRAGWVYYLGGVIPSAILSFPVAILTPAGQGVRSALLMMGLLWSVSVVAGFRAILQRRIDDHRRWMLRNVAITTSTITARPLSLLFINGTLSALPETYGVEPLSTAHQLEAVALWTALAVHVVFVEWYVLRPRNRRRPVRPTRTALVADHAVATTDS
ncbi:DUF2306 domain-containing protein [Micromonospora sp. SCSIO 07396]